MTSALACLSLRPPQALFVWAAANALAAFLSSSLYGAWRSAPAPANERRLFVVLTEEEGLPGQASYDLAVGVEPRTMAGVRKLESLRALYEVRAKRMDPEGLRGALMLGVKHGDDLARTLLLAHLSVAPHSPAALGALGALADETAHRIGAVGAARIAFAYAHLGDRAQAGLWAKRASEGPRGIPVGLLALPEGGGLKSGRITGKLEGLKPLRVALYRKTDPAAPYLLDAAALVAAVEPDARGRFSFSGLTAGRYYIALALSPVQASRGEIRILGHRGDLSLDDRKKALDLPALTIRAMAR